MIYETYAEANPKPPTGKAAAQQINPNPEDNAAY